MKSNIIDRAKFWRFVSRVYDHEMNEDQFDVYVEDVEDYSIEELQNAFKMYRRDSTRSYTGMPRPDNLLSYLKNEASPMAIANDVADKIWNAISEDGYTNYWRAYESFGELGAKIVGGERGWIILCQTENLKMTFLKNEWKNSALSKIEMAKKGIIDLVPKLPGPDTKKLSSGIKRLEFNQLGD